MSTRPRRKPIITKLFRSWFRRRRPEKDEASDPLDVAYERVRSASRTLGSEIRFSRRKWHGQTIVVEMPSSWNKKKRRSALQFCKRLARRASGYIPPRVFIVGRVYKDE